MRLKPEQISAITETFRQFFAPTDHLWLFGSRVDDTKFGGDIDLYVETQDTDLDVIFKNKSKFHSALLRRIGDQKIDIVIKRPNVSLLIHEVARETGVLLV